MDHQIPQNGLFPLRREEREKTGLNSQKTRIFKKLTKKPGFGFFGNYQKTLPKNPNLDLTKKSGFFGKFTQLVLGLIASITT